MRLTVAQALVRFLAAQHTERDGVEQRLIAGCFGIFGHGNVAGVGQALLEETEAMPFYHARNEQAMVHTAVGYARMKNRLSTLACTSSIGPGATNMVTGAALATINRLPVLLLPGDVFATRAAGTVLQEVRSGDRIDLPCGYHGPSMAPPGYDMYYLNVMAGPGERAWRFTDDPAHAWIRTTWAEQELDARLPISSPRRHA